MIIDSLCQFAVSNRHTHHRLCGRDPMGEAFAETGRRVLAVSAIVCVPVPSSVRSTAVPTSASARVAASEIVLASTLTT